MSQVEETKPDSSLSVKVSKHGSPRIAQLLKNTVFGTEGKLRYKQQEIAERVRSQANIKFLEVLKSKRVLGTVGIANRQVLHGDDLMLTQYVRYLSIAHAFKSKKRNSFNSQQKIKERKGGLREQIVKEITSHFEQPYIEQDRKGLFYAYVESANINSRNLCLSMGFNPARKVETLIFSRFNPSQKKTIQNITEFEQDEVTEHLREFYHDYSFYFEDQIFNTGFYFVKKVKGQIVGGIRAIPVNWQLVDYPGFEGWLMRDILPYLPLTSRLFQPDSFKFLAYDYVWHLPGYEHVVPDLMSHCCSLFGINLGMIWGDKHSELIKNLKNGNDLGFIYSVVGSVYADLMVRPINWFTPVELTEELDVNEEEIDDDALDFPPKDEDSEKTKSVTVNEGSDTVESQLETTESNEQVENEHDDVNSKPIENGEPEIIQKTVQDEELEELRAVLKRPIFVSALDMT